MASESVTRLCGGSDGTDFAAECVGINGSDGASAESSSLGFLSVLISLSLKTLGSISDVPVDSRLVSPFSEPTPGDVHHIKRRRWIG